MQDIYVFDFSPDSISDINTYINNGGKSIILWQSAPKGRLPFDVPDDVIITDRRYGGVSYIRGSHPRIEGRWTAYSGLSTGLSRNITFSQTITDDTPIETNKSEPYEMQKAPMGNLKSEQYRHAHNHHQLIHSELFNFSKDLNGIAIWGDSGALAPGAKVWGGFLSARSWPVKWFGYTPDNVPDYDPETDFDGSLIGLEIDVLNGGKDWGVNVPNIPYTSWKVGLQLVGFGRRNTSAIEIRTEDTDDRDRGPTNRRGAWKYGICLNRCFHENSTVLFSNNDNVARGIDFDQTTFSEGALRISGAGPNSGIIFDAGSSGEIFSENSTLNLRIGSNGLKILNSSGTEVLMEITDDGVKILKLVP